MKQALRILAAAALMATAAGCGEAELSQDSGEVGGVRSLSQEVAFWSYAASGTNNATTNTLNLDFYLYAGEFITIGTCGVLGAQGNGDTYLRFFNASGVEVRSNDNSCGAGGLLSRFTYQVPSTGWYQLRAGCAGNTGCDGVLAYAIGEALFLYETSNTADATNLSTTVDYPIDISLTSGSPTSLTIGTCGVNGAQLHYGDTYLRLIDPFGYQVASSGISFDCPTRPGSRLTYNLTLSGGGRYRIRAGCAGNTACKATVAYQLQ